MVIACDTSFLFSLYGSDAHSPRAVAWAAQSTRAFYLNSLTHFDCQGICFSSEGRWKSRWRGFAALRPPKPDRRAGKRRGLVDRRFPPASRHR
jgi:hypothetical protein